MKPKTKHQFKIVQLSSTLQNLNNDHRFFGKHILPGYVVRSRSKLFCLECGFSWKSTKKLTDSKTICPSCRRKLETQFHNRVHFHERDYFAILDVVEDFQVVRVVCVDKHMKKNETPRYGVNEVMRHFIQENANITLMSVPCHYSTSYADSWNLGDEITLKDFSGNNSFRMGISVAKVYPGWKVIPILKRNGFKGLAPYISCSKLFLKLLQGDSRCETLLKAKQFDALSYQISSQNHWMISRHWNSIKICMRNRYIIKDFKIWFDHVDLLARSGKDVLNSKFICIPAGKLKHEHNKLIAAQRRKREREDRKRRKEDLLRRKQKVMESEMKYRELRQSFFNLSFKSENIVVEVIKSVKQLMQEGDLLKHCVFANSYHEREDSLILSARVDGQIIETVEFSLSQGKVVQARGISNSQTEYNARIISLVERNKKHILKVVEQSKQA